jgi:adiponectin receptor
MCFLCAKSGLLRAATAPVVASFTTSTGSGSTAKLKVPMLDGRSASAAWTSELRKLAIAPPTLKITDVDEHLKWNPYIHTGYRQNYTFGQCLRSLFSIHNETGNVWSHLLAAFVFAWAMHYTLSFSLQQDTPVYQMLIWSCFFLTAIVCFSGSAIYHLFFPQSISAVYWLGILDFTGIAALVLGSYYPPVYYGFYCFPFWQRIYILSISLLGTVTIVAPWFTFFHSQRYLVVRVCLYAMVAVAGIVPAVHSHFLLQSLNFDGSEVYNRLYIMYGLYTLGVFFYISKFPESRYPGKFDIWLNSHQWWHLLVVCGTLVHWSNCILIYNNYLRLLSHDQCDQPSSF